MLYKTMHYTCSSNKSYKIKEMTHLGIGKMNEGMSTHVPLYEYPILNMSTPFSNVHKKRVMGNWV